MPNQLHYKTFGEGKPYTLWIHGYLESLKMWDYINLRSLKGTHVLVDLAGHGHSVFDEGDHVKPSLEFYSKQIEALLEDINIPEYNVVGHSLGGYIALDLKTRNVACSKVVLLNSNFWEDNSEKKQNRERIAKLVYQNKNRFLREVIPNLFSSPKDYISDVEKLIADASEMTPQAMAFAALAMRDRKDQTELLKKYSSDFFVVQGEKDVVVDLHTMLFKIEQTNVPYVVLPNVGHMAHIEENPECLIELLAGFFKS